MTAKSRITRIEKHIAKHTQAPKDNQDLVSQVVHDLHKVYGDGKPTDEKAPTYDELLEMTSKELTKAYADQERKQ